MQSLIPKYKLIDIILAITAITALVQISFCLPLWWIDKSRTYPIIAIFSFFDNLIGDFTNNLLFILLIGSLLTSIVIKNKKNILIAIILILVLLILKDINRLQAWIFQYLLIWCSSLLYYNNKDKTTNIEQYSLGIIQLIFIATYLWAGCNKLNVHYTSSVFNWLMGIFEITKPLKNNLFLAYSSVLIEIAIGIGLCFNYTKKIAVLLAIFMHSFILMLLITDGWNTVVYPWNVSMCFCLYFLFWQSNLYYNQLANFKKNSYLIYSYLLFIAPILNIFGYWQYNLSNTMYSGLSLEIELVLNDDGVNCFPAKFNNNKVYEYESDSSFAFDLDDWVLNELNVPYYSEQWIIPYFQKKYCTCLMQYKGFIRIEKSFRWTKNKEITIINCS